MKKMISCAAACFVLSGFSLIESIVIVVFKTNSAFLPDINTFVHEFKQVHS